MSKKKIYKKHRIKNQSGNATLPAFAWQEIDSFLLHILLPGLKKYGFFVSFPVLNTQREVQKVIEQLRDIHWLMAMIYTHVMNKGGYGVKSPADNILY